MWALCEQGWGVFGHVWGHLDDIRVVLDQMRDMVGQNCADETKSGEMSTKLGPF